MQTSPHCLRLATLLCALLLFAGCAPYRQINPGARVGAYACDQAWMEAEFIRRGGTLTEGRRLAGFHDRKTGESFVDAALPKYTFAAVMLHEAGGHGNEERDLVVWELLNAMDSPEFPCGSDDLHDEQRAMAAAKRAAE
jgi:hypothetical protein